MEVKLNVGYEQLISIINQLPIEEVNKLKYELDRISNEKSIEIKDDLKNLILNGPVMSDEKFKEFEENRKHFNEWREN
ncbi:MAG: hypothetical protein DSY77_16715 [Bacteroidetes bacterium]|nr:MAG: hypothetical protein DSY77_16715 [Bacteroidota bacterium]